MENYNLFGGFYQLRQNLSIAMYCRYLLKIAEWDFTQTFLCQQGRVKNKLKKVKQGTLKLVPSELDLDSISHFATLFMNSSTQNVQIQECPTFSKVQCTIISQVIICLLWITVAYQLGSVPCTAMDIMYYRSKHSF